MVTALREYEHQAAADILHHTIVVTSYHALVLAQQHTYKSCFGQAQHLRRAAVTVCVVLDRSIVQISLIHYAHTMRCTNSDRAHGNSREY
jgi:hypothetical protein